MNTNPPLSLVQVYTAWDKDALPKLQTPAEEHAHTKKCKAVHHNAQNLYLHHGMFSSFLPNCTKNKLKTFVL